MSSTTGGKPANPSKTDVESLGPVDEDEDEAEDEAGLSIEDRENQAGTEQMDPEKFKRD